MSKLILTEGVLLIYQFPIQSASKRVVVHELGHEAFCYIN